MQTKKNIEIQDKHGFIYHVTLDHSPQLGFSTAYHNDRIIAQREYGKIHEPLGDSDREWEMYEQLFGEWSDAAEHDLTYMCKLYFDNDFY